MAKQSLIDKILAGIDAEMDVLRAARERLLAQQAKASPRKPSKKAARPLAMPDVKAAG